MYNIIDFLSKVATIAVPLVTLYQIYKNLTEANKPFILLSDGKVVNKGLIIDYIDENSKVENSKIDDIKNNESEDKVNLIGKSYLFCFNTWEEIKDKEKEPYIVNIKVNNAGNGLVKNIKFYRIRDVINKEFVVMTEKINNVYNYGIRINKDNSKRFYFEASKGSNYYVISFSDIYDRKYYNVLQVNVADSEEKHKIIMKTYDEFFYDEKLLFKANREERIKEKQDIDNVRNSIKKIVNYIKKNDCIIKKKKLKFNCTYNA